MKKTLWRATFTYKITELSVFDYDEGDGLPPDIDEHFWDIFEGYFTYTSNTADGQFGIPPDVTPGVHSGPLQKFHLFVPLPLGNDETDYTWTNSATPGPLVTVSGGKVTDFSLNSEIGPVGFTCDLNTFHIGKSLGVYSISAKGWIKIKGVTPKVVLLSPGGLHAELVSEMEG